MKKLLKSGCAIIFIIGLCLAMQDGSWFPIANLAGLLICTATVFTAKFILEE